MLFFLAISDNDHNSFSTSANRQETLGEIIFGLQSLKNVNKTSDMLTVKFL